MHIKERYDTKYSDLDMQAHGAATRIAPPIGFASGAVTTSTSNKSGGGDGTGMVGDDDDDESSGSSSGTSGRSTTTFRIPPSLDIGVTSAFDDVITPPPPPARCMVFFDVESTGPSLRDNFVPCLGIAVIAITDESVDGTGDYGIGGGDDEDIRTPTAAVNSVQPIQRVTQSFSSSSSLTTPLNPSSSSSYYYHPTTSASSGGVSGAELWRGSEQWRRRQASFQQQQQQQQQQQHISSSSSSSNAQQQQHSRAPGEPYVLFSKKWFIHAPPRDDRTNKLQRSWDKSTLEEFWYQRANRPLYSQIIYALRQTGLAVDAHTAMREFVAICAAATHGGRTECTLFSDTSGFDFSWLSYYLAHYGAADNSCPSPAYVFGTYRPVRDVSSFFAGFALSMPGDKSKQARYPHREAMRRLALTDNDWAAFAEQRRVPAYDHDPEHDATHVGMRSAWIMWSMSRLRAQEWKMVVVVRTDLRMKENRALSQCAHAAVGAYTRAVDADVERWQACGSARDIVRCADVQALFAVRDAARDANINHYLYCCDRTPNNNNNNANSIGNPNIIGAPNSGSASGNFGNAGGISSVGGGGGAAVPSVLALGPASAESLRRIVGNLKPL